MVEQLQMDTHQDIKSIQQKWKESQNNFHSSLCLLKRETSNEVNSSHMNFSRKWKPLLLKYPKFPLQFPQHLLAWSHQMNFPYIWKDPDPRAYISKCYGFLVLYLLLDLMLIYLQLFQQCKSLCQGRKVARCLCSRLKIIKMHWRNMFEHRNKENSQSGMLLFPTGILMLSKANTWKPSCVLLEIICCITLQGPVHIIIPM